MRFSHLGAVAALSVVSRAFLLPPTASSNDNDIIKTLPVEDVFAIQGRTIYIDCPGCPIDVANVGNVATGPFHSRLTFNFSVEQGESDKLLLNGMQLYPMDLMPEPFMEPLRAEHYVKLVENNKWVLAGTPKLGYSLGVEHQVSSPEDHLSVVLLRLEIVEIGMKFIEGFPNIELKMLETPSGKLMLGDSTVTPALPAPANGGQDCATLYCKWRAFVAAKMSQMKKGLKKGGCHGGKRPAAPRPKFAGGRPMHHDGPKTKLPDHHHPRPHFGGHRPHHFHHQHSGFARFLRSVVFHVIIPIVIGVVVGIAASIVGMVMGHLVVFIWRILFRRGQRAEYRRVQQQEAAAEKEDEVPPPVYQDAPAYTGAVEEEKA
jgi:hypothetical protein